MIVFQSTKIAQIISIFHFLLEKYLSNLKQLKDISCFEHQKLKKLKSMSPVFAGFERVILLKVVWMDHWDTMCLRDLCMIVLLLSCLVCGGLGMGRKPRGRWQEHLTGLNWAIYLGRVVANGLAPASLSIYHYDFPLWRAKQQFYWPLEFWREQDIFLEI